MTRPLSPRTAAKLRKVQRAIAKLPARERPLWNRRLQKRRAQPAALVVQGDTATGDATAVPESRSEWDLQFANWLDRVYGVVSDRATEVRKGALNAVSDAGFSLMPLAIVAVALAFAFSSAKRAHRGY